MADLVIKDWQTGIGESPYLGSFQMKNVDIFTQPGSLKIAQKLETSGNSAAVVTELIIWWAQDPITGVIYGVDRQGKLYKKDLTNTWSVILGHGGAGVNGAGLAIWKDYLFYFRRTRIDVYGPLSGAPSWTNDWQAVTPGIPYDLKNTDFHPAISSGQRFSLYIGNRNFVDVVEQIAGTTFNPTNPATWVYKNEYLELGSYYIVSTLEEVGSNIAIGTYVGVNKDINIADMFFWDGFSYFYFLGNTIHFAENGVWQVKNVNNALYTVAGTGPTRLFASTTSIAQEVKRFNNITLSPTERLSPCQAAIDLFNGELLIGVGKLGGNNGNQPFGVYAYRNNAYELKHVISTGEYGVNDGVTIGAIKVHTPEKYLVSWHDLTTNTFGVDVLSNNFYTGYTANVESAIYQVGTDDDPTTYEKCEIRLGKPLRATDKVKVQFRRDLGDAYTDVTEFLGTDYLTLTPQTVIDKKVEKISLLKNVQVNVLLDTGSTEIVSPELMTVTFR